MSRKYYFSIGTIFKNEGHIMKEWLDHYFFHGVEHIYMINDKSNDNYMDILQPYINNNLVTLYQSYENYYLGRQRNLYNHYFLPIINESQWFGIFDMDEFLFSVRDIDLKKVLKECISLSQIQINHSLYGSNGLEKQPKYVVPSFTKREDYKNASMLLKYILNTDYEFVNLNVHHAEFKYPDSMNKKFLELDYKSDPINPYFTLNHYYCQSKEFYLGVKCTRGDVDHYTSRDLQTFEDRDRNHIEDLTLFHQNISLYNDL